MSACSSWCGWCGRCTDGDPRKAEPEPREMTEAEFQQAIRRSELDSLAMRARWAAQAAAKKAKAS